MVSLSIALLSTVLIGWLIVGLLYPDWGPSRVHAALRGLFAFGVGAGVCSQLSFLSLAAGGSSRGKVAFMEAAALLFLMALKGYRCRSKRQPLEKNSAAPPPQGAFHRILRIIFLIALAAAVFSFLSLLFASPHGRWDAWAIWNQRARFLFRAGEHWRDAFSPLLAWAHPDYPLLLPGFIVRCWKFMGGENVLVPSLVAALFTFGTVGILVSSLGVLRGRAQGLLAGLVLLGTPSFVSGGSSQYADVPLGFFFVSTLILLCLWNRWAKHPGLLVLAGGMAGLSAWTKNEGLLFLAAVGASLLGSIVLTRGWKEGFRAFFRFALGLLPGFGVIFYFKGGLAPPNDPTSFSALSSALPHLLDLSRYLLIGRAFALGAIQFEGWPLILGCAFLLYPVFVGMRVEKENGLEWMMLLSALFLMLAGYFLIFLLSPYDLTWHLGTSLGRLLLQLWPSVILVYFLRVRVPESHA